MKQRSVAGWCVAGVMALGLFAPVVACETDSVSTGGFTPPPPFESSFDSGSMTAPLPDATASAEPDGAADAANDAAPPAACDDGKIDPGEACDPLASCPTACPAVGCQLRALENAGTCAAKCTNTTMQTACVNGDGCCPATCNATNDDDCAVVCGNAVIEPGETCDPLASCPASCPALGCQERTLQGGGTCAAKCVNAGLKAVCVDNDGCCPPTCNTTNDNDCKVACGNGVIEKGETCDPLASCPASCPQLGCQLQKLENAGTCQAVCSPAGTQTACVNSDGCCPKGCNANNDNDCTSACGNGVVEKGEICDGNCPTCPKERYSCYQPSGSAATCDLVCHRPIQMCGAKPDGCCPFDGKVGCGVKSDADCNGDGWAWVMLPTLVDTTKGNCAQVSVSNVVPGGSYEITTCAPTGSKIVGTGDPDITAVVDGAGSTYAVANDDCTDPTALPLLAKSDCKNQSGQLVMACASPSPGGFIAGPKATSFRVTICPGKGGGGTTPVYLWYNAKEAPK